MRICNGSGLIRDTRLGDAPMVGTDVIDCPGCAACETHPFDDDDWGGGDWDEPDDAPVARPVTPRDIPRRRVTLGDGRTWARTGLDLG